MNQNKTYIELDQWSRKEVFSLFSSYEEPYWGTTVLVNCTNAITYCKKKNCSLFLYYLHCSIKAANLIEEFKYRSEDKKVVVYDVIHASTIINRLDGSFGFSQIEFNSDFQIFLKSADKEIERVRNSTSLFGPINTDNVIHYSSLPWLEFTSLSHARAYSKNEGIPKISFGKIIENNRKHLMPVSIHVHHGFVDGYHVAQYVEKFQELLNKNILSL